MLYEMSKIAIIYISIFFFTFTAYFYDSLSNPFIRIQFLTYYAILFNDT